MKNYTIKYTCSGKIERESFSNRRDLLERLFELNGYGWVIDGVYYRDFIFSRIYDRITDKKMNLFYDWLATFCEGSAKLCAILDYGYFKECVYAIVVGKLYTSANSDWCHLK